MVDGLKAAARRRRLSAGLLVAAIIGVLLVRPVLAAGVAVAGGGEAKTTVAAVCAPCHGVDGNSVAPLYPKLAGMPREYLAKQLTDFMSGKRKNDKMAVIIANLKPEDVAPLAAYYGGKKLKLDAVQDAKLAEKGKELFLMGNEAAGLPGCAGCHGPDAAGIALVPRLAGQYREYLLLQLRNFNNGTRANDPNRFMQVVAERMTRQEMKAVAEYLSGLEIKQ